MAGWPAKRATAFTLVFPILDADGDLVTAATGLDSEVSKDLGTFTDCTNEATELATSSGMYSLALTGTEMTADIIATITKTSTSGAKTAPNVIYSSTRQIDDLAFPNTSGRGMDIDASGGVEVGSFQAGAITAAAIATDAIDADALAADAIAEINATVDTALVDINLDHLVKIAVDTNFATTVHLDSVLGHLVDNGTTATFDRTTDSLEALQGQVETIDNFVDTEIADIQSRLPAALVSGRMDSNVSFMEDGIISSGTFALNTIAQLRSIFNSTATSNGTTTTLIDSNAAGFGDDFFKDCLLYNRTLVQVRRISSYTSSNGTFTFSPAGLASTTGDDYEILPAGQVDIGQWLGVTPNALVSGRVDSSTGAMASDVLTAAALNADAITEIFAGIMKGDIDTVEGTAAIHSLCTAILKAVSKVADDGIGNIDVYRTDGTTIHMSQPVTVDAGLSPIETIGVAA